MARKRDRTLVPKPAIPNAPPRGLPPLFGHGATIVLTLIASNPGISGIAMRRALGGAPRYVFQGRTDPLRRRGVLVYLSHRMRINRDLLGSRDLAEFLRALGRHYDVPKVRIRRQGRGLGKFPWARVEPPLSLFYTEKSTRLLLMIAALGEVYPREVREVVGVRVEAQCVRLLRLGVLRLREVKQFNMYGLNPDFPGAKYLRNFLRRWARHDQRTMVVANAILARRIEAERRFSSGFRSVFADIFENSDRAFRVHGIQRWDTPEERWKALHGTYQGRLITDRRRAEVAKEIIARRKRGDSTKSSI